MVTDAYNFNHFTEATLKGALAPPEFENIVKRTEKDSLLLSTPYSNSYRYLYFKALKLLRVVMDLKLHFFLIKKREFESNLATIFSIGTTHK